MDPEVEAEEVSLDVESLPNFHEVQEVSFDDDDKLTREQLSEIFPPKVAAYLKKFATAVTKEDTGVIEACYQVHWRRFSDDHYKDKEWPHPSDVNELVENNTFMMLYTELYFRHLHERLAQEITLEMRAASYTNYINLIDYIVAASAPVPLSLPRQWLWDIIDEFIYQFLEFNKFKMANQGKLDAEQQKFIEEDEDSDRGDMWDLLVVLNSLQTFVQVSKINEQLEAYKNGEDVSEVVDTPFAERSLYKYLGYFSLIGLLRLHTITGDYTQALQTIRNIDLSKSSLSAQVPSCQISMYHYVGVCYLMMNRHQDASRSFELILDYILKTHAHFSRSAGFNTIRRQRDKLFALLALTQTLSPQELSDAVRKELYAKEGDALHKAKAGSPESVEDLFIRGLPQFLDTSLCMEGFSSVGHHPDPRRAQLEVFKADIRYQSKLHLLRSFLQLYKTLTISKLAALLGMKVPETTALLMHYKKKGNQMVWRSGAPLDGVRQSAATLDFYIEGDTIHIASVTVSKPFGEKFVRESLRVMRTIQSTQSSDLDRRYQQGGRKFYNNNNSNRKYGGGYHKHGDRKPRSVVHHHQRNQVRVVSRGGAASQQQEPQQKKTIYRVGENKDAE